MASSAGGGWWVRDEFSSKFSSFFTSLQQPDVLIDFFHDGHACGKADHTVTYRNNSHTEWKKCKQDISMILASRE